MWNTRKARFQRSRKDSRSTKRRKFTNDQHTLPPKMEEETGISTETLSASTRKLSASIIEDMVNGDQNYDPEKNGYVLFDMLTFMTLSEIGRCLLCNSPVTIQHK